MVRNSGLQEKAMFAVRNHVIGESLDRHPIIPIEFRSDNIPYRMGV